MESETESNLLTVDLSKRKEHGNPVFSRFHEIELQNSLDTINAVQNRRSQMGTFFGTASLGVLAIAFDTQKAGLFFIAGILVFFFAYLDMIERSFIIDFFFRYLRLRSKFVPDDDLVYIYFHEDVKRQLKEIVEEPDSQKQAEALRRLSRSRRTASRAIIPVVVGLVEIFFGTALWQFSGWSLF